MSEYTKYLSDDPSQFIELIKGMHTAYANGENAMEYARNHAGSEKNSLIATLIAYDLQAGSYVDIVRNNNDFKVRWGTQLAKLIEPYIDSRSLLLEVGCGEATTLTGVLQALNTKPFQALGFDISWSRCATGLQWLDEQKSSAKLFVGDIFNIPLDDESIDVVYTSHSLEPNGGRELDAIRELMRVARRAVVLIEPIYELANAKAQSRMIKHGYVTNLKSTAELLEAKIVDYRLLDYSPNKMNSSGVVLIEKSSKKQGETSICWRCPITKGHLTDYGDVFFQEESGFAYSVLRGIPLLRAEHGIIASKLKPRICS